MLEIRLKKKWLDLLAQAFKIVDASISHAIIAKKMTPSCAEGCFFCCFQKIPLTTLEALAIKEYLIAERIHKINSIPMNKKDKDPCPFLVNGSCRIYEVRPIACRRYVVFSEKCHWNENPVETRPNDVLKPSRKALNHALYLTRSFYEEYGIWPLGENSTAPFFLNFCIEIRSIDWEL